MEMPGPVRNDPLMFILCGVDGSTQARNAARAAALLARRLSADLRNVDIGTGDPVAAVLAAAGSSPCDLIVVGHSGTGRLDRASRAGFLRRLVRAAPCPVLAVPDGAEVDPEAGVVLGYGVPDAPERAAATAGRMAAALGAPLEFVRVLPDGPPSARPSGWQIYDATRRVADAASGAGRTAVEPAVRERRGRPAAQLAAAAREGAIIVVEAARGGAWRELVRPSVPTRLLGLGTHAVLVVPPLRRGPSRGGAAPGSRQAAVAR
jgi:nucleotide-binding universal stress UspA family protein